MPNLCRSFVFYYSSDVNECDIHLGGCEHVCSNTVGNFICSCFSGFELDPNGLNCSSKKCFYSQDFDDIDVLGITPLDFDECLDDSLNDCDGNATCTDTDGSFYCTCNPGYIGNGTLGNCFGMYMYSVDVYSVVSRTVVCCFSWYLAVIICVDVFLICTANVSFFKWKF